MNLKNRQQLLGIIAIVAVAMLVGDRLVFTPLLRTWEARAEKIAKLKEAVSTGRALVERENSIRGRWSQMRSNALAGELSVAENHLFRAFERWSQDSRIIVNSIKPQWKRPADDYMTLECGVEATGSVTALTRFLYNIEKDPLAVRITAIQITARDDSGEQLTLGLQLSTLLLMPPKTS